MEGTISLGIYDSTGKLVRTLHRAATGDEFVAALDGYITHWDGLDDSGKPLPPGQYSAKGYMVGDVTVSKPKSETPIMSGSNASPAPLAPVQSSAGTQTDLIESGFSFKSLNGNPIVPQAKIRVSLVGNPLDRDRAGSAELSVGFDANGSWLQLADGLPLKQISTTPDLKWAALARSGPGELMIFQSTSVPLQQSNAMPGTDVAQLTFKDGVPSLETYTIAKYSNMMAFDCGTFDLPAATASPSP